MKDSNTQSYWKKTTDILTLQVKMESPEKILVTTLKTREIDLQKFAPVETEEKSTKQTGLTHRVISLGN